MLPLSSVLPSRRPMSGSTVTLMRRQLRLSAVTMHPPPRLRGTVTTVTSRTAMVPPLVLLPSRRMRQLALPARLLSLLRPHPPTHASGPSSSGPSASGPSASGPACANAERQPKCPGLPRPHNAARAQHSAQAVTWDDNLAALAQQWVNGCTFEHSGGSLTSDFGYGENLAAGTGEYQIGDAVTSWVNEQDKYDYNNPGFSMDTGHFTQVVWKSTTAIGCAYADCPSSTGPFGDGYGPTWRLHSCMYTPPGNYADQYGDNVTPN
ncbi:CAP domain-containing protein [Auriculariales sp. MPI-PUGE-AT-0066]|nr:CAP domain-containing protein [Auriculariales sp. MPI-PUGE-AT-0066]